MDVIATNRYRDLGGATRNEPRTAEDFSEVFGECIRAQQEDFDRNGLWSDGLVPWQVNGCGSRAI